MPLVYSPSHPSRSQIIQTSRVKISCPLYYFDYNFTLHLCRHLFHYLIPIKLTSQPFCSRCPGLHSSAFFALCCYLVPLFNQCLIFQISLILFHSSFPFVTHEIPSFTSFQQNPENTPVLGHITNFNKHKLVVMLTYQVPPLCYIMPHLLLYLK